ncbi:MAG: hypothetical protein ACM65L_04725 [Microcoleus sp.]
MALFILPPNELKSIGQKAKCSIARSARLQAKKHWPKGQMFDRAIGAPTST